MHLKNSRGKPVRPPKTIFWDDHFVVDGAITLKLPKGNYTFEMERGLEYLTQTGRFTIDNFADDAKTIEMKRFVNMADEGWWSGDLNVQRAEKEIDSIMRAEDLHVVSIVRGADKEAAPSIKVELIRTHDNNRFASLANTIDRRAGNSVLLLNLERPLNAPGAKQEPCSGLTLLNTMVQGQTGGSTWVDVERPYSWDLPLWLALGKIDSIQLAHSGMGRSQLSAQGKLGRPADSFRYPGMLGTGRWNHDIFFNALNCGLRLPPSAGSGTGSCPNPAGYNRAYVYLDGEMSYDAWWDNFRAGRVLVTNGPLIRPTVQGERPGHTFHASKGETLEFEIGLNLSTRDQISYLEVIKDGQVEHEVRLDQWKEQRGRLPKLTFAESGWFLVRAVADVQKTYRFATTGAYFVQIGEEPRISRASVQFFLDWLDERIANVKRENGAGCDEFIQALESAKGFWNDLRLRANAE